MMCGSSNHGEGLEHIDDADYLAFWDDLRSWRTANPSQALQANSVRNEVRQLLLPRLPAPRNLSSMWWIYLCATSGRNEPWMGISEQEINWLTWAFWGVIDIQIGDQPQPGVDF